MEQQRGAVWGMQHPRILHSLWFVRHCFSHNPNQQSTPPPHQTQNITRQLRPAPHSLVLLRLTLKTSSTQPPWNGTCP